MVTTIYNITYLEVTLVKLLSMATYKLCNVLVHLIILNYREKNIHSGHCIPVIKAQCALCPLRRHGL